VDTDRHCNRCPARGDFFEDLEVDLVRLIAAAELLGIRKAQ